VSVEQVWVGEVVGRRQVVAGGKGVVTQRPCPAQVEVWREVVGWCGGAGGGRQPARAGTTQEAGRSCPKTAHRAYGSGEIEEKERVVCVAVRVLLQPNRHKNVREALGRRQQR